MHASDIPYACTLHNSEDSLKCH